MQPETHTLNCHVVMQCILYIYPPLLLKATPAIANPDLSETIIKHCIIIFRANDEYAQQTAVEVRKSRVSSVYSRNNNRKQIGKVL